MRYLSSIERLAYEEGFEEGLAEARENAGALARKKGFQEGLREALLRNFPSLLECIFGPASLALMPRIRACKTSKLERVMDAIAKGSSVADLRKLLR